MTENTLKLLNYLKTKNDPVQLKNAASDLGLSWQGVNALFNQLVKNGFGVRVPQIVTDDTSGQDKEIKLLILTAEGRSFSQE